MEENLEQAHDARLMGEKLQCRRLVPLRGDDQLQNLAFMVDSAPEIAELAVDLHERLVQMPTPLRIAAHVRYPLLSDLGSKHRAEPVPPKPDRLMADVDPALRPEILALALCCLRMVRGRLACGPSKTRALRAPPPKQSASYSPVGRTPVPIFFRIEGVHP